MDEQAMNSDVKIIHLPISRWREYKELRLEALKKEPQAFGANYNETVSKPDDVWIERVKASEIGDKDLMYFAEVNGKLIGMIGAFFNTNEKNQVVSNIWGVYVNEQFRGKGIGKKLMEQLINRVESNNKSKIIKLKVTRNQKEALSLYQRFGFKIVGTIKYILGDGKEHDEYIMEKVL